MSSEIAALIQRKIGLLFEGKHVVALVSPSPSVPGHIWVVPKQEFATLDQTPDFVVAEMAVVANRMSMALFEGLGAQGTNVVVQNGASAGQPIPYVMTHVIPRAEKDNINLTWQPKQLDEEEMSTIELKLKEATKNVGIFEKEKAKPIVEEKAKEMKADSDDYKLRQLRRIP